MTDRTKTLAGKRFIERDIGPAIRHPEFATVLKAQYMEGEPTWITLCTPDTDSGEGVCIFLRREYLTELTAFYDEMLANELVDG